ncbi:arsenate reductase (glutaredoxin) [Brevundimonas sp. 2R-24]|uniref:Arsenate reductase n=1 Tax=Peiella sedimenti TaxID=3061083 RepID=A0ABT8SJS7_9CAUL|nr:arsenate reductase (glutaredoxin) [Caulobacteraceae bacterium XZ-24]
MAVTVFHNPNCSTSRRVLEEIRAEGYAPEVVEYMKAGWTEAGLRDLLARMNASPRDVLRTRGGQAEELGLLQDGVSDQALLKAMIEHPVLVERPIVKAGDRAVLARPAERWREVV